MNLIVIEGLDGAGKSTQIGLLQEYFRENGRLFKYLHFPRTDAPFFGELISKFLRGEFGSLEDVDPYIVAMLYAGDRKDAAEELSGWLSEGKYVLLDRYVYSNIAYQCAKLDSAEERERLKEWILDLEFGHFGIPKPDINIFLDVPLSFTASRLGPGRNGNDRSYLKGNSDIHEDDLNFQGKVRELYITTARKENTLKIVKCLDQDGGMASPGEIFSRIVSLLKENNLV